MKTGGDLARYQTFLMLCIPKVREKTRTGIFINVIIISSERNSLHKGAFLLLGKGSKKREKVWYFTISPPGMGCFFSRELFLGCSKVTM